MNKEDLIPLSKFSNCLCDLLNQDRDIGMLNSDWMRKLHIIWSKSDLPVRMVIYKNQCSFSVSHMPAPTWLFQQRMKLFKRDAGIIAQVTCVINKAKLVANQWDLGQKAKKCQINK